MRMSPYPEGAEFDPDAPYNQDQYKPRSTFIHPLQQRKMAALYPADHADGCACDACMPGEALPEPVRVGSEMLSGPNNGYASARAKDGEVWMTVKGWGLGELSMPKDKAMELMEQLSKAIEKA